MALLDIALGYDCNVKCTYCTITDEMRRRPMPTDFVARTMAAAARAGFDELAFTGGEPTMRDDLPALVRLGRRLGYRHVKVASNGLRYAHDAYLDLVLAAGVDRFHVSLHAPDDASYERVVQRAGTAALRAAALANLVRRGLDPVADLILTTATVPVLERWLETLHGLGLRRFALWLVSLTDANAANEEQLPRLGEVAPVLERAFDAARAGGYEVVSLHVPRCFVPRHTEHVRHPGEERVRVVTPDAVFDLGASRLAGGIKPEACGRCRFEARCPGLRADYAARFGVAELVPVGAEPAPP
ncbi:MAG: radical SAM protein [Myxococcales bacterium]|nr:radical SAM protein [Myxococcales bacterium]